MSSRLLHTVRAALAVTLCMAATPVAAQNTGRKSTGGLFGREARTTESDRTIDLTLTAAQSYDDNLLAGISGTVLRPDVAQIGGAYADLGASLQAGLKIPRGQFSASVQSDGRYYEDQREFLSANNSGAVGLSWTLNPKTRLAVNQTIGYSPAYFNGLLPGLTAGGVALNAGTGPVQPLGESRALLTSSLVTVDRNFSPRSSFGITGLYRYSRLAGSTTNETVQEKGAGARYQRGLTKALGLRLGYTYREGAYTALGSPTARFHDLDIGLDYAKALSISKNTRVGFTTGSTIVNSPLDATGRNARLQYRLTGGADLVHDMGRSWQARATYSREVRAVQPFVQPVFADVVLADLTGLLASRVQLTTGVTWSVGNIGDSSVSTTSIRTSDVHARLVAAVTRRLALFGDYSYYRYNLGEAVDLSVVLPPRLTRNSVRLGLTLWLPLLRR